MASPRSIRLRDVSRSSHFSLGASSAPLDPSGSADVETVSP